MKRRVYFLIPLIAVILLAASLLLWSRQQAPAWKAGLDQYLDYLRATGSPSYHVITTAPASLPANFTPAMSAESYSSSIVFQTSKSTGEEYSIGLQPVPYPPEQVMCVLLDVGGETQLVYVALHNNLYNADWVVHIAPEPWGSALLQSHLNSLGCRLNT